MASATPRYRHSICWIRRDLRLSDHVALSAAKKNSDFVTVVFVFDSVITKKLKDKNDRRLVFIHKSLQEVHRKLQGYQSSLVVLNGDPVEEIPNVVREIEADAVYANIDIEPYAKKRDHEVAKKLFDMGCSFHLFKDHVIYLGSEITNRASEPYKVFTPYKKQWLANLRTEYASDYSIKKYNYTHYSKLKSLQRDWTLDDLGFEKNTLWIEAGEDEGKQRLKDFSSRSLSKYHTARDHPAKDFGTSGLSVHLRHGTISIRACVREVLLNRSKGAEVWLSELIWRDFYQMILDQFPHVVKSPFRGEYRDLKWPGTKSHFQAWCKGKTGYPIIDAAMRHFNDTGWMHNRLRMIVAAFLTKDLLVDWKLGEKYFARYLLDFDLASNNGGWQWSASTGCDAQPYFRIFNPITQSEKFDSKGEFIRRHCPELRGFSDKQVHAPWKTTKTQQDKADCIIGKDYPKPIVDHGVQRNKALSLFKKYKKS